MSRRSLPSLVVLIRPPLPRPDGGGGCGGAICDDCKPLELKMVDAVLWLTCDGGGGGGKGD